MVLAPISSLLFISTISVTVMQIRLRLKLTGQFQPVAMSTPADLTQTTISLENASQCTFNDSATSTTSTDTVRPA